MRRMRRRDRPGWTATGTALLALLPLSPGTVTLGAQTVEGTVVEAGSGAPVPGVLVSILEGDDGRVTATLSGEDGAFSLDVGRFGRFRLRAERIGLQTVTSASFRLFTTGSYRERIVMGQRPVQIEGLVVDSRVEQCRIDGDHAVVIQRWWQEIRTALDISSVVQDERLATFRLDRYERAWDRSLSRIRDRTRYTEVGLASRPFVSAEAAFLAEHGFVQGDTEATRDYYAPDADVLLSDVFLDRHCFSLAEHDDRRLVGLSFEPTRADVADIAGTLWVDTTTAELQSLDFRYRHASDEIPESEAGGFVGFEYLPSGAWIVREWYIRMPSLARDGDELEVVGYTDVGAEATPMEAVPPESFDPDVVGAVRGVVWDSVAGRGLEGAKVEIVGTELTATTDAAGEFVFPRVPEGEHRITFSHPEPQAWGLGAPLLPLEVEERFTTEAHLAVPSFRRVAGALCQGSGLRARAIVTGDVVGADGVGLADVTVVLGWEEEGRELPEREELRVSARGHFVACRIPPEVPLTVDLRVDGRLIRGFEVTVPPEGIVYRRIQLPLDR